MHLFNESALDFLESTHIPSGQPTPMVDSEVVDWAGVGGGSFGCTWGAYLTTDYAIFTLQTFKFQFLLQNFHEISFLLFFYHILLKLVENIQHFTTKKARK